MTRTSARNWLLLLRPIGIALGWALAGIAWIAYAQLALAPLVLNTAESAALALGQGAGLVLLCALGAYFALEHRKAMAEPQALAPSAPQGWSIRSMLFVLAGIPLAAFITVLAYDVNGDIESEIREGTRTANRVAQFTAIQTAAFLADSEYLLRELANRPLIRRMDPARCDPLIGDLTRVKPHLRNVFTFDAGGRLVCSLSVLPAGRPVSLDLDYVFNKAAKTRALTVGRPVKGRISGRWISVLAYPVEDAGGALLGVVGLTIDLVNYHPLAARAVLPPGMVTGILGGDGTVIARSVESEKYVGTKPASAVVETVRKQRAGTIRAIGLDNVERFIAFTPIAHSDWIALATVPVASVLAPARALALNRLLLAVLLTALVVAFTRAWKRRIERPVQALAAAAQAVARGDLSARAAGGGPRELEQVTRQFNAMLDALALERDSRLRALESMEKSEKRYRELTEYSPNGIMMHTDGRIVFANPAFARLLGAGSVEQLIGMTGLDFVAKDSRELIAERQEGVYAGASDGPLEYRVRRMDGSELDVEAVSAPIEIDGRQAGLVIVYEITQRKRAQRSAEEAHQRLRALAGRLIQVREEERAGLARELHDEVGQALTAIKIRLAAMEIRPEFAPLAGQVRECAAVADQALRQVRGLSLDLRPPHLDDLGLAIMLKKQAAMLFRGADPEVKFDAAPDLPPIAAGLATTCYRVAQEALTNVARHARAQNVRIGLAARDGHLELLVEDDGAGYDPEEVLSKTMAGSNMGLLSMEERVLLAGGTIAIATRPGAGTSVRARFPLAAHGEAGGA